MGCVRNDQVIVLNDDLENYSEDSLEEKGTEDREKIREKLEIFQGYWVFWIKPAKVGREKRKEFKRHFWGRIDSLSNLLCN